MWGLARHREPCDRQESVPEGLLISSKLLPFMLTAKSVEVSNKPVRTKIVVFPRHAPVSSISCSTAVAQPSSSWALTVPLTRRFA